MECHEFQTYLKKSKAYWLINKFSSIFTNYMVSFYAQISISILCSIISILSTTVLFSSSPELCISGTKRESSSIPSSFTSEQMLSFSLILSPSWIESGSSSLTSSLISSQIFLFSISWRIVREDHQHSPPHLFLPWYLLFW